MIDAIPSSSPWPRLSRSSVDSSCPQQFVQYGPLPPFLLPWIPRLCCSVLCQSLTGADLSTTHPVMAATVFSTLSLVSGSYRPTIYNPALILPGSPASLPLFPFSPPSKESSRSHVPCRRECWAYKCYEWLLWKPPVQVILITILFQII